MLIVRDMETIPPYIPFPSIVRLLAILADLGGGGVGGGRSPIDLEPSTILSCPLVESVMFWSSEENPFLDCGLP
jgi:hypothetical protein